MSRFASVFFASISAVLFLGCDQSTSLAPAGKLGDPMLAKGGQPPSGGSEWAVRTALPSLHRSVPSQANAVNGAGLIAGQSWDRAGLLQAVTWKQQNGVWTITALPFDATASSARAADLNEQGDVAGVFFPGTAPRPVLWLSTGGFTVLGCGELGEPEAISSGGQVVVGTDRTVRPAVAAVWQPGSCRVNLPPLVADSAALAYAVNGNGTIVGGSSVNGAGLYVPVRWKLVGGAWQVELLDSRAGVVLAANSVGDLAGQVQVPCVSASAPQCSKGMIWYAAGGSRELPSLGGEATAPRAINSAGEVVGLSTTSGGSGFPFFWSATVGIRQLPISKGGWAFGMSDVRSDGTRLVVGEGNGSQVWVVKP